MAAPLESTRHPGIYRRGDRYVVAYRAGGRQRRETVRTLKEAMRVKRGREADRDRGEYQADSRIRFRVYADEWIGRYLGNGRRGFTDETREDYRRDLVRYAYPFFDDRLGRTVSGITARDVANWVGWLCDPDAQGRELADATVRRIASPVRACLATAAKEGVIRANPTADLTLPHRPQVDDEDDDEGPRPFTRSQLGAFLAAVDDPWRLFFEVLAATGLRWSEVAALRWRDLDLQGPRPAVRVRRALCRRRRRGEPARFKVPKSRHSKRSVPLDVDVAEELSGRRSEVERDGEDDLVFASLNGEALRQENVRRRILKPAAEAIDVDWAGFHTFRHTYASILIAEGRNLLQVSRALGHHSPAFTMSRYGHLLEEGVGEPLNLAATLKAANVVELSTARRQAA